MTSVLHHPRASKNELELAISEWGEGEPIDEDAYEAAWWIVRRRRRTAEIATDPDDQEGRPTKIGRFLWAKSLMLAADASEDNGVLHYRRTVLDDALIPLDEIKTWVQELSRLDGPGTFYTHGIAPLDIGPSEHIESVEPRVIQLPDGRFLLARTFCELLHFPGESGWRESVTVASGGHLDDLRMLSDRLAETYPWQPAQAVGFVLTGVTPIVIALELTMPMVVTKVGRSLIHLEIDPEMPVEDVVRAYTRARLAMVGPRVKHPAEKGVEIVIHCAENEGLTTFRLWRTWNKQHQDDQFETQRLFRQAWKSAQKRIRGVPRRQG
jgi:hypothetical protein